MKVTISALIISIVFIGFVFGEISTDRLAFIYNHPKTSQIHKKLIETYMFHKRLAKCLKFFRSRLICENKSTWYMWAQIIAKDIMNGNWQDE